MDDGLCGSIWLILVRAFWEYFTFLAIAKVGTFPDSTHRATKCYIVQHDNVSGTSPVIPGDVKFNHCTSSTGTKTTNRLYELMVHESGHVLGLSGFSFLSLILGERERYIGSHPTIPDSVMNYNWESRFLYDPERPETKRWIRLERDCSPHPFDIMTIYSLYQTIP